MSEDLKSIKINYSTNAKEVSSEVDKLTESIDDTTEASGKNNAETKKQEENLKSFKTQIREATQELMKMSATYGETSKEAVTAAKKVADLKDQMGFASDLVDKFNPDQKFKALGAATQLASTAMSGAVSGMALFGDQSEDTEKALLKVQAAMAFSQAISGLSDLGDQWETLKTVVSQNTLLTKANGVATMVTTGIMKLMGQEVDNSSTSFKGLKMAITSTGIGLLVTGLALLINNFDSVKKVVLNLVPGLAQVGDFIMGIVNSVTDFIGVTSEADRALDRLKANADASIALNKKFIAEHGSQIDEFTKQKIEAKNKYNEALKEDGANQVALGEELNRELAKIEYSRGDKAREIQAEEAKKAEEERKKEREKLLAEKEKEKQDLLKAKQDLASDLADKEGEMLREIQDLNDKTDQEKLDRRMQRDLEEIEALKKRGADVSNLLALHEEEKITLQQELDAKNKEAEDEKNAQKLEDRRAFDEQYYAGIREYSEANNEAEIEEVYNHKMALLAQEEELAALKIEADGGTEEEKLEKRKQLKDYYDTQEIDAEKAKNEAIVNNKKALNNSLSSIAQSAIGIAKEFAGKNKKAQKGILIAENAVALASVIINTAKGVSVAMGKGVAGIPEAVAVGLAGTLSTVKIVQATAKGLKELGGGEGGGGGGDAGGATSIPSATSSAPQVGFQASSESQIGNTLAQNTNQSAVVKAYVVSSEMSTAQEVDRNKTEGNSF